jgi:hypothetical protein
VQCSQGKTDAFTALRFAIISITLALVGPSTLLSAKKQSVRWKAPGVYLKL